MRRRISGPESWGTVGVRPTDGGDLDAVLALETAPENARFVVGWPRARHRAAIDDPDVDHLVLVAGQDVVGYVILRGVATGSVVELLRIVVGPKGRGLGRAALAGIARYTFERLGAHRLWLDVVEHNARARRVYERAGFKVEGVLRDALERDGGFDNLVVMSLLRPEWQAASG